MPTLRVHAREARDYLLGARTEIGRARPCTICVPEPGLAPVHARIVRIGREHVALDLGHGLRINGAPVRRHILGDGDRIGLAELECVYRDDPAAGDADLERRPPLLAELLDPAGAIVQREVGHEGLIGSGLHAALRLGGSLRLARLLTHAGEWWVESLEGQVFVDGAPVVRAPLRDGAVLTLGRWHVRLRVGAAAAPPAAHDLHDPLAGLLAAFARAGLPAPPVPAQFVPRLQEFGPWWFGTRRTAGLYQFAALLAGEGVEVDDYLICGHAGHGVDAHAIHYFLRDGPLLLLLEIGHGGAHMDAARTRADVGEAFAQAAAFILLAHQLRAKRVPGAGLRIFASSVRDAWWDAGQAGGAGPWREVLADAYAWARSPEPYLARLDAPAPGNRPARATVADHRVRVYMPGLAEPQELQIGAELLIGRGSSCALQLRSSGVSRRHCRVYMVDGFCFVEDLGSTHGTRVEGRPIAGPCALAHGARITLQDIELVYCEAGRASPPRLHRTPRR